MAVYQATIATDVEDVRAVTGLECYVNDEPDDPNPGIIIDARGLRTRALSSDEARAIAVELLNLANYNDSLTEV